MIMDQLRSPKDQMMFTPIRMSVCTKGEFGAAENFIILNIHTTAYNLVRVVRRDISTYHITLPFSIPRSVQRTLCLNFLDLSPRDLSLTHQPPLSACTCKESVLLVT